MSAADDMESASSFLDRAKDTTIAGAFKNGIAGWALAAFSAGITGMQEVLNLILFTPVAIGIDVMQAAAEGFIIGPFNIVLPEGAQISADSLGEFGFIALPISVGLVLATIYMIILFVRRPETTDMPFAIGLGADVIPFVGVEEEDDPE